MQFRKLAGIEKLLEDLGADLFLPDLGSPCDASG